MITIIDFGSQTTHLISRRITEMGIKTRIIHPENSLLDMKQSMPLGIILSGGPSSVYEKNAPLVDKQIFKLGIPILGICYGQQLICHLLGGKVEQAKIREYGPSRLIVLSSLLFKNIKQKSFKVWMSHGDEVLYIPRGFKTIAQTDNIQHAAIENVEKKIFAVQFHPEVEHTEHGLEILKNFLNFCGEKPSTQNINIPILIESIQSTVGNQKVIMAFSGGTDSFVTAGLIAKAIKKNLIPVYVDSGLMRDKALYNVKVLFPRIFGFQPKMMNAKKRFLTALHHVIDPEKKRKIIGALYVKIFEETAKKIDGVVFLAQGTTYADFIHSHGTKHSVTIKSHHNVGGLPKHMNLKLLEPIRYFYTDQVRWIGKKIGLPDDVIYQQPFPGPGFAVRIIGNVTKKRLKMIKSADAIVIDEIEKNKLNKTIFQYFAVLTGTNSTAIKGDGRFYGEVVAIRAYTTKDRMTADIAKIPYEVLQTIATRIVNEVPEVSRVVYDITTKPPATMEWE